MNHFRAANPQNRRDFMKTVGGGAASFMLFPRTAHRAESGVDDWPNILWITCEDISPALGCYGDRTASTPNLDRLAAEGVTYADAFTTAPICAPARSCLITGVYATSLGTQHLRSEIPKPASVPCLPQVLRTHGYYCTNNSKTDYNFNPEGVWDENGDDAHWRNRPAGRPFFSVFNITVTHEGNANGSDESMLQELVSKHDPADASLPPYFPDTPEMKRIWAKYYDLVSAMDAEAGRILRQLHGDGLVDSTVIFFFSDHGFGLPRYKRWPYDTGLHVPLIVRIPPGTRVPQIGRPGSSAERLVSLVDFAPTVLSLAGIPAPSSMQGRPFLGSAAKKPAGVVFGARDRADDVYDVCRTVRDGRYRYIRNYMPHLPYIQEALIYDDEKTSFRELRRARNAGLLSASGEAMFKTKPVEELYDILRDPGELHNLAESAVHGSILRKMRTRLREWIIETRDTGFLHESEVMIRSENSTPYEMARDPGRYDVRRILAAAERTGDPAVPLDMLAGSLGDADSGVRFWAVQALIARGKDAEAAASVLEKALTDASPCVRIAAAEASCHLGRTENALAVLADGLVDRRPWVSLQAATATRLIGDKARPILSSVRKVLRGCLGDASGRYKNWSYPMFIGFALDQVLINCGENPVSVKKEE
jgi:N-sulfoglucosamine sulfohydrolase